MIVKAWNNGAHHPDGNGYGIKITSTDRDQYFNPEWKTVLLTLDGRTEPIEIKINKKSFWNETCRELISMRIGKWLIKHGFAAWPKRHPPEFDLEPVFENCFRLRLPRQENDQYSISKNSPLHSLLY